MPKGYSRTANLRVKNLKKLFNMVKPRGKFEIASIAAVNIVGAVSTAPIKYSPLLNPFRGINPSNTDAQNELVKQQGEMKAVIKNYYALHYNQDIKPKRANPSYLLDGLLGGLTGFVGVLGISSSITTIAMGLSVSLAFGFLITNPVGWGIIGLAVALVWQWVSPMGICNIKMLSVKNSSSSNEIKSVN